MNSTSETTSLDVFKRCSTCKKVKPLSEFYRNRAQKSGYDWECKKCKDKATSARRKLIPAPNNAINVRRSKLRKKYGITPEAVDATIVAQDGRCAICTRRPHHLCVDDGPAGVRGLLCQTCLNKVRDWEGRDVLEIAESTTDTFLSAVCAYLLNPPGLRSEDS